VVKTRIVKSHARISVIWLVRGIVF